MTGVPTLVILYGYATSDDKENNDDRENNMPPYNEPTFERWVENSRECERAVAAATVRNLAEAVDALLDAEVVDGDDVAVLQVAGDLRFVEEAVADLLLLRAAALDGDEATDVRVEAFEDGAEAAFADLLDDLVLSDGAHGRESGAMLTRSHRANRCRNALSLPRSA